jgi:phosphatidylethanolamine-binding protein (PEBP) family uncharacterized protein
VPFAAFTQTRTGPAGTEQTPSPRPLISFALIIDDPDAPDPRAPTMTWVHWVVYDIPADAQGLPEDAANSGLPAGGEAGSQRLETRRLRWPLCADRKASILP